MKIMKKILLVVCLMLLLVPLNVGASSVSDQRKAVVATADAYYNQEAQLQYDSYRRNLYSTPEDATSQHSLYTNCNGLVYMSYYQALGVKLPTSTEDMLDYAKNNVDNKDIVLYYYDSKSSNKTSSQAFKEMLDKNINKIQPGDIIVYTGHVVLIKSVNVEKKSVRIIHATGDKYSLKNHNDVLEANGGIGYQNLSSLKDGKGRLALFRVITNGSTFIDGDGKKVSYDITEAAQTRMKYPSIDIGKIINNVGNQSFASLGDKLVYQLRIRNKSADTVYKNIKVVENIDSKLVLVDAGDGTVNGGQISWTVSSIKPGEYVTLLYTLQVPNDKTLLDPENPTIIVSTGKVGGIATSKIETKIGKRLSSSQKAKVKDSFNKLKTTTKATTSRGFINEVYKDALGLELGIASSKNFDYLSYNVNNKSGGGDNLSVYYTSFDGNIEKYLYNNYYGLRLATENDKSKSYVRAFSAWNTFPSKYEINDRARSINIKMLEDGDIILAYVGRNSTNDSEMGNKGYIFLDNSLYRYRPEKKEFEVISDYDATLFLKSLIGDNYIILRPYKTVKGIKLDRSPSKVVYTQNTDDLDLSNGSLKVSYDDGTVDSISMNDKNVKVSGFDNSKLGKNKITVQYDGYKVSFNVDIVAKPAKEVKSISIKSLPTKKNYLKNVESLDKTGGKLTVVYDDNTSKVISFKNDMVKLKGFDNSKVGTNNVVVEYRGAKTNFDVEIIEKKNVVVLSQKPLKSTYVARSENLDLTGGVLTIVEEDGTKENISLDNENVKVSGFDNSNVGVNNVTVEYDNKKLEFAVEVIDKKVSSIVLSVNPIKTNYIYSVENLDLTGGVLAVTYDDGTIDFVSMTNENVKVSGFDNSKLGTNTIAVQYDNFNTTFDVEIVNKKVSNIEIGDKPTKQSYIVGKENLDLTGGIIFVNYEDGSQDLVSLANAEVKISGFDNNKVATNSVVVEYAGLKTEFDVAIIEKYKTTSDIEITENKKINLFIILGCGVVSLLLILLIGFVTYKIKHKVIKN